MFSILRNRLGVPGIISVIALVFAMFGGAYAASNQGGASASAKQQNKAGKRGPRGPRGKQGPMGPQGPAGPQGATGAKGANGANGKDGVEGAEGKQGPEGKQGKEGKEGPQGKEGSPWTAGGTLPSGKTVTGAWGFATSIGGGVKIPISFPLPLAGNGIEVGATHYLKVGDPSTADCPGTVVEPKAAAGHLCIYTKAIQTVLTFAQFGTRLSPSSNGEFKYGAVLGFVALEDEADALGEGTWALTAP